MVQEAEWELAQLSVSQLGSWAAVAATSATGRPGVRLFLVNLDTLAVSEAAPSGDAQAQLAANSKPGMSVAEWAADERSVRFPAATVYPSTLNPASYHSGKPSYDRAVAVGARAWLEIRQSPAEDWKVALDDSPQAMAQPSPKPDSIDSRLGVRWLAKGSFELTDAERGGAAITRLSGMTWYHLRTATISPTGDWIAITVNREAFFSHGRRGLLVERATGRRFVLEDDVLGSLQFRPGHHEILGISRARSRNGDLVRWRYP